MIGKLSGLRKKHMTIGVLTALAVILSGDILADDPVINIDIKTQKAGTAFLELAEKSGVQILIPKNIGKNVDIAGISGEFTLPQALEKMLSGTGLSYKFTDENLVIIQDKKLEASDEKTTEVEELVVTGSRLIRDPGKMTKQMTIFDRTEIERSGVTRLDEFLRRLPQNVNAPTNVGGGFVGDGYGQRDFGLGGNVFAGSGVNLRGLGSQYTLILVNGRRPAAGGQFGGITDISNIPIDRVERIEILFDGAAAVYGAGAIGGVVNIITNREYEGTNVNLTYGETTEGGSTRYNFSIGHTFNWQSGSLTGSFSYQNQDGIDGAERDLALISDTAFTVPPTDPGSVAGSVIRTTGGRQAIMWIKDINGDGLYDSAGERITGGVYVTGVDSRGNNRTATVYRENPSWSFTLDDPSLVDGFDELPQDNGYIPVRVLQVPEYNGQPLDLYGVDLSNYQAVPGQEGIYGESAFVPRRGQSLSPEDTTYSLGLDLDQELADNLKLAMSVNYSATEKRNDTRNRADELGIGGNGSSNPFGVPLTYVWNNQFPQQYQESKINTYSFSGSLDWQLNDDWQVLLGWGLSKNNQSSDVFNQLYRTNFSSVTTTLQDLLNGYYYDENGNEVHGVAFHDPLLGYNSGEELVAAVVDPLSKTKNNTFSRDMDINIRGVLGQLPGGDLRTNITLSHQRKRNVIYNDNAFYKHYGLEVTQNTGDGSNFATLQEDSSYTLESAATTNAIGFEIAAPLIGSENSKALIQEFLLSASARVEDYSNLDDTGKLWSLGFNWQIVDQLAVRFNRDHGIKVPESVRFANSLIGRNYQTVNIYPDDISTRRSRFIRPIKLTGGATHLTPEIYDTNKLGFIYTPDFVEGLRAELSFSDTKAKDRVGRPGVSTRLTEQLMDELYLASQPTLYYATPEIIAQFEALAAAGEYVGPIPSLEDTNNQISPGLYGPTLIRDDRTYNVGSMMQQQADLQLTYNFSNDWGDWFFTWRHQYIHEQAYLQSDICASGNCFSATNDTDLLSDNFNKWVDIVGVMDERDFAVQSQIFQPVPEHSSTLAVDWQYRGLGIGLRTDYRSDTSMILMDQSGAFVGGQLVRYENIRKATTSPTRSIDMTFTYDFSGDLFDAPGWLESTRIQLTIDDVWRREQEVTQKYLKQEFIPLADEEFVQINGYALEPRGRAFSLSITSTF
ncbi:TonB-dependent receptor plug domain-containing protein [Porticoccaceae bacterium LTM1]|nr:TonB-dependent receptor plug domain-containing protein [Porticoccaceae bacterium LTM1]